MVRTLVLWHHSGLAFHYSVVEDSKRLRGLSLGGSASQAVALGSEQCVLFVVHAQPALGQAREAAESTRFVASYLRARACACACARVRVRVHVCMCARVLVCTRACACVHVRVCVCARACVCRFAVCVCARACVCVHARARV